MVENIVEMRILEGFWDSNCYLISVGSEVAIIDPGVKPGQIIWEISNKRKTAVWSTATHGHFDHMDSAREVSERLGIPFYLHPEDQLLIAGQAPTQLPENIHSLEDDIDGIFELEESKRPNCLSTFDQKALCIGGMEFEIIETPGHTSGSVSFYLAKANALFCGDAYVNQGKYFTEEQFRHSIGILCKLPKETQVFPGHGGPVAVSTFLEEVVKL